MIPTVAWQDGEVVLIDQRRLPDEEVYLRCRDHHEVAAAIKGMAIRGAPAIGVAAAFGIALGVRLSKAEGAALPAEFERICAELAATRPTAVNLFWAIERMRQRFATSEGGCSLRDDLLREALAIQEEDVDSCRRMGDLGADLLPERARVLTHCNAGALATGGIGTALAPLYVAHEQGRELHVYVDETRPVLQGARLTAWELAHAGIPCTVLADGAAAALLRAARVDLVIVGADRIARNGDFANKIGTYGLAVLARHHGVPFYCAAPSTTLDATLADGEAIPIEQRDPIELRSWNGKTVIPPDAGVMNPAFDVTPARYVTAYVMDRGVVQPPFDA